MKPPPPSSGRAAFLFATVALLTLIGAPSPTMAQSAASPEMRVDTGVDPDTVTIGEPFRSAIRIHLPDGFRVEIDELPRSDSLEAVSAPQVLEEGGGSVAAIYDLVAWFTGDSLSASVPVRVIAPDGATTEHVLPLGMPVVASVLPAGDEEVVPRPVKSLVVPPATTSFPWWWLLLAAAAIAALFFAWWRSRRKRGGEVVINPRAWALSELDALLAAGGASVDPVEQYRRGSWILRGYLARVDDRLGTDLTSGEVARRARTAGMEDEATNTLAAILEAADRVKFSAGHPATDAGAREAVEEIRALIRRYPRADLEGRPARRAA